MHLSLLAAGVGPGDEVITSPITWPATGNVVVHCGARPIFVDVRDSDLNLDPDAAAAAVTERTKAILPVHLAGQPADLDPLLALGLPVIEDAAHATESAYRGRKIGALSLATCFSLYATKNVAAGEGGMVTTDDDDVAAALRNLRLMRRGEGSLYDVTVAGFKANLSDVLAAIALCQLDKIEEHAAIRRRHVAAYDAAVADLPGISPLARDPRDHHALHLYVVRVDAEAAGADRDAYQRALREENIGTSIHFLPVHRLTFYRETFPDQPRLPVAERAGDEVLSLPLSPAHSDADIEDAIDALRRVHARFTGALARAPPRSSSPPDPRQRRGDRVPALVDRHRADGRDHPGQPLGLRPRRLRHLPGDDLAHDLALGRAAPCQGRARAVLMAPAAVLRQLRRRAGAADGGRRGRRADHRALAPPSGREGDDRRGRVHGAGARLGRNARPRRGRPGRGRRALRRRPLPRHPRARLRRGHDRARAPALLPAARSHARAPPLPARAQDQAREAAAEPLLGDARVPARSRDAGGRARGDDRGPVPAGDRHLALRRGGRRRRLAGRLHHPRPAPLPRADGAVHAQRPRPARGVLRRLPRALRRPGGRGVRGRLPLLRRLGRHGPPGRRSSSSGAASGRRRRRAHRSLDRGCHGRRLSRPRQPGRGGPGWTTGRCC